MDGKRHFRGRGERKYGLMAPPPLPPSEKQRAGSGKRMMDQHSISKAALPQPKKKRVEEEEEDYIDLCSSSEEDNADIVELMSRGKPVEEKEEEEEVRPIMRAPNPYVERQIMPMYSEADLVGVSEWPGAREERRKIVAYAMRFPYEFNRMEELIWLYYKTNIQDGKIFLSKMAFKDRLLRIANEVYRPNRVKMFAVGSTVNGCGAYNSDMDICLVVYNRDDSITEGKEFSLEHLRRMRGALSRDGTVAAPGTLQWIPAAVPIIKMKTSSAPDAHEVDINMNNIAGVYNSVLVHYYSRADFRFPALCLIVKHWAINMRINDSKNESFNSYSLVLLVIHYLQCGVVPAVLPNLQYLYPDRFGKQPELRKLNLYGDFKPLLPKRVPNEQCVGELLIGFFRYYASFDFRSDAISIRKGNIFPRSELVGKLRSGFIFIEDPIDGGNTAKGVRKVATIERAFKDGAEAFNKGAPYLSDIVDLPQRYRRPPPSNLV